ncbi:RNA polymerase sigma-70 factor [Nannocystis bainbridge]|uniref:RNA polymerase sigma-70 factor n=1 Tax=Nannocystis bainbridge TaxID=2995303 RepID=A0ABT5DX72_9BACT|nr:RNA polymerase sigma-70 factor [Nannocystis bainbridge]MDC0718229.1 RNA polymerase sigma-70 factor [Nannocystis bainbridge]
MSPDEAATLFGAHRSRLFGLAYRMLGSAAEAEDVLQEAHVRWQAAEHAAIEAPGGWLTTVVSRLCLDQLKSARSRREAYVGTWLPEPLPTEQLERTPDLESISLAFLVLLEALSPLERAVFVLREVFDYDFAEVAAIVGREEAACRQLAHRAREHVRSKRPRFARSREQHEQLLGAFLGAVAQGDLDGLQRLLADDVVAWSDGGGRARAARNPVFGPERVGRMMVGIAKKGGAHGTISLIEINGWPAAVLWDGGVAVAAVSIEADDDQIHALHIMVNPEKLAALN